MFVLQQIGRIEAAFDAVMADAHRAEVLDAVLTLGYSRLAVERAATALLTDTVLDEKMRYAKGARHPLSPADFRRVVEGTAEASGTGEGAMSYGAMLADAHKSGLTTADYRPVRVEGEEKPRWVRA